MTVTLADAKERIRKLAEEKPGFVYERPIIRDASGFVREACRYFTEDGEPSCIVGHAFADELRQIEGGIEGQSAYALLTVELGADHAAGRFLGDVQSLQDSGVSWGAAYQCAVRRLR